MSRCLCSNLLNFLGLLIPLQDPLYDYGIVNFSLLLLLKFYLNRKLPFLYFFGLLYYFPAWLWRLLPIEKQKEAPCKGSLFHQSRFPIAISSEHFLNQLYTN